MEQFIDTDPILAWNQNGAYPTATKPTLSGSGTIVAPGTFPGVSTLLSYPNFAPPYTPIRSFLSQPLNMVSAQLLLTKALLPL